MSFPNSLNRTRRVERSASAVNSRFSSVFVLLLLREDASAAAYGNCQVCGQAIK
jgi:hypothetical protein